jgi:hypothetical protein
MCVHAAHRCAAHRNCSSAPCRGNRLRTRVTGKREEYVKDGLPDPEDVWGEDAEQDFVEASRQQLQQSQ